MPVLNDSILRDLNSPYIFTLEQIRFYQTNRFIKLKQVLEPETIRFFNEVISDRVAKMNTTTTSLKERDTYGKAFLQLFNLWREDELVKTLVFSKKLANIAAALMQVKGVRLYHDQALFKESGDAAGSAHPA